jgi:hypothetical protein
MGFLSDYPVAVWRWGSLRTGDTGRTVALVARFLHLIVGWGELWFLQMRIPFDSYSVT